MTDDKLAKIERRIALLLRKAEGTDNPHEAATFTGAAQAMMLRWGIEEARLRQQHPDTPAREAIEQRYLDIHSRYAKADIHLAHCVVRGLGSLKAVTIPHRRSQTRAWVSVVGYASEVQHAIMLTQSLRIQVLRDVNLWWRDFPERDYLTHHERFMARRQFMFAFATTVEERLAELRREAVDKTGDTTGTELALRDRSTEVAGKFAELYPKLRDGNSLRGSVYGSAEGSAAGARADLGGARLGGQGTRRIPE